MHTLGDAEREILKGRRYAILATVSADGSIHLTPVWYLFENERFYIGSSSSSRKVRNLEARAQATIIVDVRRPGAEGWVYASGHVELLRGDQSREITDRIHRWYLTEEALNDPRTGPVLAEADDITICLHPEQWRSWNAKEIDEKYFGGVLGSDPDRWFRPVEI